MITILNENTEFYGFSTEDGPKYEVTSYYGKNYSGIEDTFVNSDLSAVEEWVWEHAANGGYIELCGPKGCVRFNPDELAERVDAGENPITYDEWQRVGL